MCDGLEMLREGGVKGVGTEVEHGVECHWLTLCTPLVTAAAHLSFINIERRLASVASFK